MASQNKKKTMQQRNRAMFRTDRMISQIKYEIRTEKKERLKAEGKTEADEKKPVETGAELKPVQHAPLPKKTGPRELDEDAVNELITTLRKKLKIPDDKPLVWSHLEYNCIYHGIRLSDMQKKALKAKLSKTDETGSENSPVK